VCICTSLLLGQIDLFLFSLVYCDAVYSTVFQCLQFDYNLFHVLFCWTWQISRTIKLVKVVIQKKAVDL